MSIANSQDFFINIKNPPFWDRTKHYWEQSLEAILFYENEIDKIHNGVTIDGVFIHPWLYFHINFFKTIIPDKDLNDQIVLPTLRDNEWYMAENYAEAQRQRKGLFLYGSRRWAKSSIESSILHWNALTRPNTTEEIICGATEDLKVIGRLLQVSSTYIHPALALPTIRKDWTKHIQFGFKEEKTENPITFSEIFVKNADAGKDKASEKGAGGAPSCVILDEALEENTILHKGEEEVPIKDIEIGDLIYDDKGLLTEVLEKIKFDNIQLYEMTFSDGRKIECCENHLWSVIDKNNNTRILTTGEIKEKITKTNPFSIKNNKPIQYPERYLKITPYAIGYLIGDGGLQNNINFSYAEEDEEEILSYFKEDIDNFNLEVVKIQKTRSLFKKANEFKKEIIRLRLNKRSWEKEIPKEYLIGSENQRLELLKGLLDSDGCCSINKSGNGKLKSSITFTTTSEKLSKHIRKLCWSLGINTSIHIRQRIRKDNLNRVSYDIILQTDRNLFKLKRKSSKIIKRIKNPENKKIVSVTPTRKSTAYCIKVDNESKLFIAGDYLVTHNCGKFAFLDLYNGLLPSISTPHGLKAVVMLSGTSGNEKLSQDAFKVLSNPEGYKILPMNWDLLESKIDPEHITWTRKMFGMFTPPQMAYEEGVIKQPSNLAKYLKVDSPSLENILIDVTDWAEANKIYRDKREKLAKDKASLMKEIMYHPLDSEECFTSGGVNPFPVIEARLHKLRLVEEGNIGKNVDIFKKEDGTLGYVLSDKERAKFPFEGGIHNAPVVFYDDPPNSIPYKGENVSGLDPYKATESTTKSVGSFYVLARRTDIKTPIELIKASYASRPTTPTTFYRTCELLIEGWSAECLMENADLGFLQYLDAKNKAESLLADGVDFSKTISPNSNPLTKLGYYPTPRNKEYIFKLVISYCWEEIVVGVDAEGNNITKLGIEFIPDIDLLDEIIAYKEKGNFDRIVAFGSALAWAKYLDSIGVRTEPRPQDTNKNKDSARRAAMLNKGYIPFKQKK